MTKEEVKVYGTAQFWVEGGMYSIEGLKELVKHFEKVHEHQNQHLARSLQPAEKKERKRHD